MGRTNQGQAIRCDDPYEIVMDEYKRNFWLWWCKPEMEYYHNEVIGLWNLGS